MSALRAAPFSLGYNTAVVAKVRALNALGWSDWSPESTSTATIQTVPQQMAAVTQGSATSNTQIVIDWTALTTSAQKGGAEILSYNVYWNQGSLVDEWVALVGENSNYLSTSYIVSSGVTEGETYTFKVRAENRWGYGAFSDITSVLAAAVPTTPATVTTSIVSTDGSVQVQWNAAADNGSPITSYLVEIKSSAGTWVTDSSNCDGSSTTVIDSQTCTIPMSTLTSGSFSLSFDTLIEVRVSATNAIGTSSTSTVNTSGARTRRAPATMTAPVKNSGTDTTMTVGWTALTTNSDIGNSAITSYKLEWNQGDGTDNYVTLVVTSSTSYSMTGLTAGTIYRFRVSAANIYGYGSASTSASFIASSVPGVPSTVTVTQSSTDPTEVDFTWSAPASNGGLTIDSYQMVLYNPTTAVWAEDTTNCPASNTLTCSVPMSTLTTSYGYTIGDLIRAKVRAHNSDGYGDYSSVNSAGMTAMKEPQSAPTSLARGSSTSKTAIELTWTGVTTSPANGGITGSVDYIVYWDQGSSTWTTLGTSSATTYTTTASLTEGGAYQFKVAASNDFGTGPETGSLTVYAAIAPSGLDAPTTTYNSASGGTVIVDWSAPSDNGGLTVTYTLEV